MKIEIDFSKPEQIIEITEDCEIVGRYVGKENETLASKITFVHKKIGLHSRIDIKAVVFDKAKFDFEGLLKIEKGATGTDTYLKIDCLVVGEGASARAIPSLEINESEVKGGHGATIGYLDPMQIYYLNSRGLNSLDTEKLLINAFLG
jgi:Fe-S cluster assembly protein SufD